MAWNRDEVEQLAQRAAAARAAAEATIRHIKASRSADQRPGEHQGRPGDGGPEQPRQQRSTRD
jgi:hypothetical protein